MHILYCIDDLYQILGALIEKPIGHCNSLEHLEYSGGKIITNGSTVHK